MRAKIASVLRQLATKEMADVRREWGKYNVDGNASINFHITQNTPGRVEGEYRAQGMKMWMLEYGSGSLMDKSNPLLEKYKQSEKYNKVRGQSTVNQEDGALYSPEGTEIRTRPSGRYYDLDGQPQEGSGLGYGKKWKYGLNAEHLHPPYAVEPIPPHHIIKDIVPRRDTVHKQQFKEDLAACMTEFFRGVMNK